MSDSTARAAQVAYLDPFLIRLRMVRDPVSKALPRLGLQQESKTCVSPRHKMLAFISVRESAKGLCRNTERTLACSMALTWCSRVSSFAQSTDAPEATASKPASNKRTRMMIVSSCASRLQLADQLFSRRREAGWDRTRERGRAVTTIGEVSKALRLLQIRRSAVLVRPSCTDALPLSDRLTEPHRG